MCSAVTPFSARLSMYLRVGARLGEHCKRVCRVRVVSNSSSACAQPRLAAAAAMCSAVGPFSARLSMYLRAVARPGEHCKGMRRFRVVSECSSARLAARAAPAQTQRHATWRGC